jgi:adenosylcobinamide-phosphate synthase
VLWRPSRLAGAAHVAALAGGAAGATAAVDRILGRRRAVRALVVWAVLGGRSLRGEALAVARLLDAGRVEEARRRMPALVSRDVRELSAEGMCRAAVESLAENSVDAVCAPLLWAAALGPAGAAGYRAVNTLDAMVGYRNGRYERFGWAAARADDALNWPAARAVAALAVALAPVVGGRPAAAWRVWRRDGARHPSPNAGHAEAAFAGSLGVTLGRAADLGDGPGPSTADVRRAARLSFGVGAVAALVTAGACTRSAAAVCARSAAVVRARLATAVRACSALATAKARA